MNQFRTVYDKLESKVSDNTEDLSVNEYNIILSNKLDSVTLIKFLTGFRNKNLDPTQILTLSIPLCTTGEHLLIIAWCIRYGANITTGNLFKESEGDHILMYIYKLGAILEITIKNTLILMLRLSGSIFQGSIPEGNEKDYLLLTEPLDNILKNIETKSLQKIAIMLDREDLLNSDSGTINLIEVIRDHSLNIFRNFLYKNLSPSTPKESLDLCINYYNVDILRIYLNLGYKLSYHQINIIILHLKNSPLGLREISSQFLNEHIKHGGKLDIYQSKLIPADILKSFHNSSEIEILSRVQDPLLESKKDDSKSQIKIENLNIEDIKQKQYIEMGAFLHSIESKNDLLKDPRLNNKFNKDYIDIIYHNGIPLMTPDMIENVITTKKLPYIDTTLEDISLIDNQRRLLKRLGYSVNKSNSKLTSPLVDDSYFSKMEKAFSMFIQINTGKDIELIAVSEMENILKSIDTNMSPSIQLLSALHLKRTFLITCYENMIEYQEWFINDLF